jgi:hypothetical protein
MGEAGKHSNHLKITGTRSFCSIRYIMYLLRNYHERVTRVRGIDL